MFKFFKNQSLRDFQKFISSVYSLPDDRLYSIWDLLAQQQRFTMRALKGIRKNDRARIKVNLLISFSWLMAIVNRVHIDLEDRVWQRFPMLCSFCGKCPCVCRAQKPKKRAVIKINNKLRPKTLIGFQEMFEKIYPSQKRTLEDAGIHLAEEVGELNEAIMNFLGQHQAELFEEVALEISDYVSCIFGVANSAKLNIESEMAKIYYRNCHICHKAPCACSFEQVARLKT